MNWKRISAFLLWFLWICPATAQDTLHTGKNSVQVFKDSILIARGKIKNGQPHGNWFYYDNNGNKIQQLKFKRGKQRYGFYFNPDGTILYSTDKKGKKHYRRKCNC